MRTNWLTLEQKNLLAMLDELIAKWPTPPRRFTVRKTHYRLYRQIVNKKRDFPDANADVRIDEDGKYRGVEIASYKDFCCGYSE